MGSSEEQKIYVVRKDPLKNDLHQRMTFINVLTCKSNFDRIKPKIIEIAVHTPMYIFKNEVYTLYIHTFYFYFCRISQPLKISMLFEFTRIHTRIRLLVAVLSGRVFAS